MTRSAHRPSSDRPRSWRAPGDRGRQQDAARIWHGGPAGAASAGRAGPTPAAWPSGHVDVKAKTNEIPMFVTLLDRIALAGVMVTADA